MTAFDPNKAPAVTTRSGVEPQPSPTPEEGIVELAHTIIKQAEHDPANVMMLGEVAPLARAFLDLLRSLP